MTASLHELDTARLDRLIRLALTDNPAEIAAHVVPELANFVISRCDFGHAAMLLFAVEHHDLLSVLAERGLQCSSAVPSTVVRERLRIRCGLAESPPVYIVHARKALADGSTREVEIFVASSELAEAAALERVEEIESHVAFVPRYAAERPIREICEALVGDGLVRDGGGFNPHENVTTLYFRRRHSTGYLHRLELACPGEYAEALAKHLGGLVPDCRITSAL